MVAVKPFASIDILQVEDQVVVHLPLMQDVTFDVEVDTLELTVLLVVVLVKLADPEGTASRRESVLESKSLTLSQIITHKQMIKLWEYTWCCSHLLTQTRLAGQGHRRSR